MSTYRYVVGDDEFNRTYAHYKSKNYTLIVGASSFFVRKEQLKFVKKSSCRYIDGEWYLAGEYARKVMKEYIPDNIDIPHNVHLRNKLSPPRLYIGQYNDIGAYIDLRGAYYQIYRRLWYDTVYPRGRGKIPLAPIADKLHFWKAARNAVVGISISHNVAVVQSQQMHLQYTQGELRNYAVWHIIQTVLHNIAEYMHYSLGAFYVATDGYFLPAKNLQPARDFLDKFGLEYRYTLGVIDLRRWGGYEIREYPSGGVYKVTDKYNVGGKAHKKTHLFRNIERLERKTLIWWKGLEQ